MLSNLPSRLKFPGGSRSTRGSARYHTDADFETFSTNAKGRRVEAKNAFLRGLMRLKMLVKSVHSNLLKERCTQMSGRWSSRISPENESMSIYRSDSVAPPIALILQLDSLKWKRTEDSPFLTPPSLPNEISQQQALRRPEEVLRDRRQRRRRRRYSGG